MTAGPAMVECATPRPYLGATELTRKTATASGIHWAVWKLSAIYDGVMSHSWATTYGTATVPAEPACNRGLPLARSGTLRGLPCGNAPRQWPDLTYTYHYTGTS